MDTLLLPDLGVKPDRSAAQVPIGAKLAARLALLLEAGMTMWPSPIRKAKATRTRTGTLRCANTGMLLNRASTRMTGQSMGVIHASTWASVKVSMGGACLGALLAVGCLQLLAGVSAPRPTHFLCWCKESKQRKHLEELAVVAVVTGRCAPAGEARCSRKVLLDTQCS